MITINSKDRFIANVKTEELESKLAEVGIHATKTLVKLLTETSTDKITLKWEALGVVITKEAEGLDIVSAGVKAAQREVLERIERLMPKSPKLRTAYANKDWIKVLYLLRELEHAETVN